MQAEQGKRIRVATAVALTEKDVIGGCLKIQIVKMRRSMG
jgi:hypothetical protein